MILAETSSGGSPLLLLILAMPVVLYMMMRSQKKKMAAQQAQQRDAGIGDEIMTTAGIFGTIVGVDDDEGTVMLEIAPGTQIKMIRAGIARRVEEDDEYDDDEDDDDDDEPDVSPTPEADDNAQGPFRS